MNDHTLPLFSSRELGSSLKGAMFFAGGPVWCMDWLPVTESGLEHYVALCAYRGLDEVRLTCRKRVFYLISMHIQFYTRYYNSIYICIFCDVLLLFLKPHPPIPDVSLNYIQIVFMYVSMCL